MTTYFASFFRSYTDKTPAVTPRKKKKKEKRAVAASLAQPLLPNEANTTKRASLHSVHAHLLIRTVYIQLCRPQRKRGWEWKAKRALTFPNQGNAGGSLRLTYSVTECFPYISFPRHLFSRTETELLLRTHAIRPNFQVPERREEHCQDAANYYYVLLGFLISHILSILLALIPTVRSASIRSNLLLLPVLFTLPLSAVSAAATVITVYQQGYSG